VLCSLALASGCERKVSSPTDPTLIPADIPVPSGLSARVADSRVHLTWTLSASDSAQVDQFVVYRIDSLNAAPRELAEVTWPPYIDSSAINGTLYAYAVAVRNHDGIVGRKSTAIRAQPRFVSVRINEDSLFTRSVDVRLALTAAGATLVRFGHDSLQPAEWRTFGPVATWTLQPNAGAKRVFAQFQFADGAQFDGWVSDSITLDDRAGIQSLAVSDSVLAPGEAMVITLDAVEVGGIATYDLSSRFGARLFDDGVAPDQTAGDGRYTAEYVAEEGDLFELGEVLGRFTDAAGNRAPVFTSASTVSVRKPPLAPVWVSVVATATDPRALDLTWTGTNSEPFSQLLLRRSTTSGQGTSAPVVEIFSSPAVTSYHDTGLVGSTTYYYTLELVLANGLRVLSAQTSGVTPVDAPPAAVLVAVTPTGDSTLLLSWTQTTASDFESYRVYRALTTPALTPSPPADSLLVSVITASGTTTYAEAGQTRSFYYRVFVFDRSGQRAGSNVVWGPKDFGPP